MRVAQLLGALGAASLAIAASSDASTLPGLPSAKLTSPSTATPSSSDSNLSTGLNPTWSANSTTPFTATSQTTSPNATTSHSAQLTGGAIPQQMQASMAGLLGFCIMGLVML
ncbi:hypothetical protein VFPPC_12937 [Pochonia chlamydosporia 170]|uniref:Uncharacterized protein n=1 Tax=Pochonia chlamydosporia 170 TaxID=1380566 RepID=A0A179G6Y7_METCM|nr:hypothetical protein VFPPC_12937 [Pochonia chlamydosporia 170]OAQ73173.1 hypothetical protein VFPPC_12937 [Pochonia chlamydosporia 170]